jgi:hypothetical protein
VQQVSIRGKGASGLLGLGIALLGLAATPAAARQLAAAQTPAPASAPAAAPSGPDVLAPAPVAVALGATLETPAEAAAAAEAVEESDLGVAVRPGAPLDPRPFAARRALHVDASPGGVARLRLAPEDLAAARPDLADLRVVDRAGREWPYLLSRGDAGEWMRLDPGETHSSRHQTWRRFALPAAPVPIDHLELAIDNRSFDRPYRLIGRDARGRARRLAAGRLTRARGDLDPSSLAIPISRVRSLELVVEDGSGAPLVIRSVRVRVRTADLFLVVPPGEYTLLLGAPGVPAPRYPLTQLRGRVLGTPAIPVRTGPLVARTDDPAAQPVAERSEEHPAQRGLVWGMLALAFALPLVATMRAARTETEEGGAPPSSEA